jgi:hypothetical protein
MFYSGYTACGTEMWGSICADAIKGSIVLSTKGIRKSFNGALVNIALSAEPTLFQS